MNHLQRRTRVFLHNLWYLLISGNIMPPTQSDRTLSAFGFLFYRGDVSFLIFVNFQGAMCFFNLVWGFKRIPWNHTFIIENSQLENTHCCTATGSTARSQGRWVRCSSCWIKWVEGIDEVGWIVLDYVASWWFQPIWKTWIRIQNLPQVGVKINYFTSSDPHHDISKQPG